MLTAVLLDIHDYQPTTPDWVKLERYEYCQDFLDRVPVKKVSALRKFFGRVFKTA
ncbi:MAG: hypothetical protein J6033_04955 [Lachnospiraceae bacterium]|nr:hypothetical protein [Lachnospiraceae bacterium]